MEYTYSVLCQIGGGGGGGGHWIIFVLVTQNIGRALAPSAPPVPTPMSIGGMVSIGPPGLPPKESKPFITAILLLLGFIREVFSII